MDPTRDDPDGAGLPSIAISANARHGLFALGVVARLNTLPLEVGPIAAGREAILFPSALDPAIDVLYAIENELWRAGSGLADGVRFDRRDFERTLLRLVDLLQYARRAGLGVRLRL